MNTQRGVAWDVVVVTITTIAILLGAAWYFLNGMSLPGILSPNNSASSGNTTDPNGPRCTITSSVKKVTSPQQVVKFSWTSSHASAVTTQALLTEYDTFQLPLNGSASFQAKNNFVISRVATVEPDKVRITLTAVANGIGNDCSLEIPYEAQ